MARLSIHDDRVTVTLSWWEKLSAHRSHLTIPLRVIKNVEVVPDASRAVAPGRRTAATRIKGVTATGTWDAMDGSRKRTFVVAHRRWPGIALDLEGATYDRIVISTTNADVYARQLHEALF